MTETHLAVFKGKKVRRTIHNNEWWFSVIDIVEILTESANPRDYWYKMKIRVKDEEGAELSTLCRQLKLTAPDGKMRENLRDHMNDLELIFSMLGEASTTEMSRTKNAQGFPENKEAAHKGGKIAGDARGNLEKETGKRVSTRRNYLPKAKGQGFLNA